MVTGNALIDDSKATWIVSSDEAGWGALAGPLCVAACAAPRGWSRPWVTDSKMMTPSSRERAYNQYHIEGCDGEINYTVELTHAEEFDRLGPWPALLVAHTKALKKVLAKVPANESVLVVVDGLRHDAHKLGVPGVIGLPKADRCLPACSMASVLAKVTHDRVMCEMNKLYPGYDFAYHMGYGSSRHVDILNKLGPCPIHRRSYDPVKRMLAEKGGLSISLEDLDNLV